MTEQRLSERSIFEAVIEKASPQERAAYLDQACGGDTGLRREIEALLAAHDRLGEVSSPDRSVNLDATVDAPICERVGTVIGPYKLLEQIGEGGMGLVFVAEQQQPVRRKVALKVIKPGMDTRQVIARFEAERQALALMDHPNIAKIFDGGQMATGRPYFVLELVKGVPITDYCDQNQMLIRQRLKLFVDVCRAVQHAHQKGIIHRDLKPSNVLVVSHDTPVVKVIDFGVAKAIGQQLTDKTLYTQFSQMVGTPLYMSPEQARQSGLDVDTRSDIYSLGVLLYELLTGTTPFDKERLRAADYDEMRRIIREEEPPRPSTRLSTLGQAAITVSTNRRSDAKQLSRLFRGEMDWIVMKALEKDRNRRYETASAFAADVQHYLNDEPVLACPPSAWYRFRKFARRNRGRLTAYAMLGLAMLLLILTGIGLGLRRQFLEKQNQLRASALLQRLLDANTNEVPNILADIEGYRRWLDPLLHDAQAQATQDQDHRKLLHTSLALLPVDASQVAYLYTRLIDAEPSEFPVVREALTPHKEQLLDRLWAVVEAPEQGKKSQRLRAAAALATYDPQSARWATCSPLVVHDLARENAVYLYYWSEAYRPVKDSLLKPLAEVFRDRSPEQAAERSLATSLLGDYAAGNLQVLADLLMDADDKQFVVIYPKLKGRGEKSAALLTGEIAKKLPADLPSADKKREKLTKRQANAAVALFLMNQAEKVWPLLRRSDQPDDPGLRSYVIHRLSPLGVDAAALVKRLDEEPDVTIRRALVLSLGEYSKHELSPETCKALVPKLQTLYCSEADPGLHAAVEWLLRQWQDEEPWLKRINNVWAKDKEQRDKQLASIRQSLRREKEKAPPQWYVNSQGQTMVVIAGPVEFVMGSPPTEADRNQDERQQNMRIRRTFALASMPVTVEQYRRFDKGYQLPASLTRLAELPVVATSWHQAAAYCNWLSQVEGIDEKQWCYEIKDGQVTKLKASYLRLTGYRLPTEAEMEYATRAGALTSRYYGETEELLGKYAWYMNNAQGKTWPVGSLKPNDLGFFDMHGNVYTWCQERYKSYAQGKGERPIEETEDALSINNQESRVMRGSSFSYPAWLVRSAYRNRDVPTYRGNFVGFRPARTLVP